MSAVEVPAELIERVAGKLAAMRFSLCGQLHGVPLDQIEACPEGDCPGDLALIAKLRALLPQPTLTCPYCGHEDDRHNIVDGCLADALDMGCGCCITADALPQVRALLAAERDSKPAPAQPRVWNAGDPEPKGVTEVWGPTGERWWMTDLGWWLSANNSGISWRYLVREYGPLTDVPPAGAR